VKFQLRNITLARIGLKCQATGGLRSQVSSFKRRMIFHFSFVIGRITAKAPRTAEFAKKHRALEGFASEFEFGVNEFRV